MLIKIFSIQTLSLLHTLQGHEGPVWQVTWAHPKYGDLLASASYDGKVIIWKEQGGVWSKIKVLFEFRLGVKGFLMV